MRLVSGRDSVVNLVDEMMLRAEVSPIPGAKRFCAEIPGEIGLKLWAIERTRQGALRERRCVVSAYLSIAV